MKVRKKPIIFDAEQFIVGKVPRPDGVVTVLLSRQNENFCLGRYTTNTDPRACNANVGFGVLAPYGWIVVRDGDWIITDASRRRYVCNAKVFAEIYEIVNEE